VPACHLRTKKEEKKEHYWFGRLMRSRQGVNSRGKGFYQGGLILVPEYAEEGLTEREDQRGRTTDSVRTRKGERCGKLWGSPKKVGGKCWKEIKRRTLLCPHSGPRFPIRNTLKLPAREAVEERITCMARVKRGSEGNQEYHPRPNRRLLTPLIMSRCNITACKGVPVIKRGALKKG